MITIYSENKSPRLLFTLEVIFKRCLGLDYKLITDWDKFKKIDLPRINYSERVHKKSLQIRPHDLLFENSIRPVKIKLREWNNLPVFFLTNKKSPCPFDLFAASFYLVSRYEEYLDFTPDEHGRFPAKSSLAYRSGFLERPIVNEWAAFLVNHLANDYPNYGFDHREFKFCSTIDVDMAYSYKHKGFWRNLGGMARELMQLRLDEMNKRIRVLRDQEKDPFDNFEYQQAIHKTYGVESIYFILMADHGKFDKNIHWENESFMQLIQELSEHNEVGIHPSYHSNKAKKKLKEEINRLESILLKPVKSSRQHFLKLDIRETYKKLESYGIENDHSMGYSDLPGFRASICSPYPFFDLTKNEQKKLVLYPFVVMDVALMRFLKLSPDEAILKIETLFQTVKQNKGTFISVFHNESLSDFDVWKGWRKVYESMLKLAQNHGDSLSA